MADDVVITIGGDASGLTRAGKQAEAALQGMASTATSAGRQASGGIKPVAESVQQLNRVLNASRGSIGGVGEALAGLASGASSGRTGMLALASGVGLAVAAVGALASITVSTIADIDSLSDSLTKQSREAIAGNIESVKSANDAFGRLSDASAKARIGLASIFAPMVEDAANALTFVVSGLTSGLEDATTEAQELHNELVRIGAVIEAAPGTTAWGLPSDEEMKEAQAAIEKQLQAREAAEKASAQRIAADRLAAERAWQEESAWLDRVMSEVRIEQQTEQADAYIAAATFVSENRARIAKEADEAEKRRTAAHVARQIEEWDSVTEEMESSAAAKASATQTMISDATMYAGAAADVLGMIAQAELQTAQDVTRGTKEERLRAFRTYKATAIAQSIIGAAAAIVQSFAQLGPVAGAVGAATTAIATGIQIAAIANQQPPAHVGAMISPDELQMGNRRILDSEAAGVFSPRATEALGPQGLRDVVQTGRTRSSGDTYYFIVNGEEHRTRQIARPDSMLGRS